MLTEFLSNVTFRTIITGIIMGMNAVSTQVVYIAVFGALGCLSRYFLSGAVHNALGKGFPYGTLVVNVIGAYAIGLVMELGARGELIAPNLRVGIAVGFLGGLTTFSTFSHETFRLIEEGNLPLAALNIIVSVLVCLVFTYAGIMTARCL